MTLNSLPAPITNTPSPEPRYCDGCQAHVPMVTSRSGELLCAAGHNMTAALNRDFELSAAVADAAGLFLGMSQEELEKWAAIFLDCLGPAAQDFENARGRMRI